MSDEISPELKAEFQRFLALRQSGTGWHAKLAMYASTLDSKDMEYLVNLCDDNEVSIETVLKTQA